MRLLKGVVVEPATHKNGKTSIAVKCDGVIHRIYASGEYHPYFRFQVGDSVLITMGSDNKPRIIENEMPNQVSEPLKEFQMPATKLAEQLSAEWNRLGVGCDQCPYSGLMAELKESDEEDEQDAIVIFDDYDSIKLSISSAQELLTKLQSLSELNFEEAWDLLKEAAQEF